ncbi:transcriptional regulatory protein moc3 [Dichotomopilus funicola]|uniref:Transcriptional regulatory protein moc3 n=1 Tax=Dichotomopilus funicola TaxID=1934379 RepID=A0AAN6V6V6_9PEZI|nr:transcriptional regulatory protein moc3 [Dichotomopilus funicola]
MSDPSHSNRSSAEPSSNPTSPSPSPAPSPPDPPKKRTRASKPKVRTGCITWVKCDEGKPACLRCSSTGRTCDGYDKSALARYRSPDPNHSAELARAEFVRACQWNETLRSMRRIEADIDGTDTEKRLFARFRAATADGTAAHLCNFAAFWRRLNPSTGCQDEAVKHAVVALAAAYQLFQYPNEPIIEGFARRDLEVITIQQYNRSIENLQSHAGSSAAESIRLTLVCCLAFISLETLRGNHEVAVTHLRNGLRILQSLPEPAFDFCAADSSLPITPPATRDSLMMPDIIQLFARFELSACFYTHGLQPVVSERGYRMRNFDDGSHDGLFPDVAHARVVMARFQHDVIARLHEIASVTAAGDDATAIFWADTVQQRQQACLLARSARLGALVADFFSPARLGVQDPAANPELASLFLDLLHFRCAQFLIGKTAGTAGTPGLRTQHQQSYANPFNAEQSLLTTILHLASRLATLHPSPLPQYSQPQHHMGPRTPTNLHTHLLGPLYLVATHPTDNETRTSATHGGGGGGLSTSMPRALCGVGCLPPVWDALVSVGSLGGVNIGGV